MKLTPDEREQISKALRTAWRDGYSVASVVDGLCPAVESIADARLERVTAATRHPHKGPNDTDASMLLAAATRLEGGYEPGGSHTKQTVARVLRAVAALIGASDE